MSNNSAIQNPKSDHQSSSVERVVDAVRLLLERLSPNEREQVRRALQEELRPIATPRGGEVLSAIVYLLPRRESWTPQDFKSDVSELGVEATDKEIQNALAYLTRRGHLRRIGYGQYRVDGSVVASAEDL